MIELLTATCFVTIHQKTLSSATFKSIGTEVSCRSIPQTSHRVQQQNLPGSHLAQRMWGQNVQSYLLPRLTLSLYFHHKQELPHVWFLPGAKEQDFVGTQADFRARSETIAFLQ